MVSPPPLPSPTPNDAGLTAEAMYTMAEAARLKGVSYHTVSRAVRRGILPARRQGRMVFVGSSALDAWQPMRQRAPHKHRDRTPDPEAATAPLDLTTGERIELAHRFMTLLETIHAAALPLPDIFDLLCDRLAGTLGLTRVEIWEIDASGEVVGRLASFGWPMNDLPAEMPVATGPAFTEFIEAGEARMLDASAFGASPAPPTGVTTLLAAPLRIGRRPVGVLFGDRGGKPFALTPEQLLLAQGLANHAALAVELARLRAELATLREEG